MDPPNRRNVLPLIIAGTVATAAIVVGLYRQLKLASFSFLTQQVDTCKNTVVDAGPISDFFQPGVYTNLVAKHGLWVIHESSGKVFALRSICTHLGCTPNWKAELKKFLCPCHGSEYDATGQNIKGPTDRSLERLKISIIKDRLMIDREVVFKKELGEWINPESHVNFGPS